MNKVLKTRVRKDKITASVSTNFDYAFNGRINSVVKFPKEEFDRFDFGIGLIVGASGSGKTTLLKSFGELSKLPKWKDKKAICSHFKNEVDATDRLGAVGLNSIPTWLKPYNVLSMGESFRANLARQIKDGALIDEFTSVIDRNVARSCSKAIRKYVDRENIKGIVLASCHFDIIDWLQPDWVFNSDTGELTFRGSERRFPKSKLKFVPCSWQEWEHFKDHHYLTADHNKAAWCWLIYWKGVKIGFMSCLAFPNAAFKNGWRVHRLVILPDYQGLGFGAASLDAMAEMMLAQGKRFFAKAAHPKLGQYWENSDKWKPTSKNRVKRTDYIRPDPKFANNIVHLNRICYSFEYVGEPNGIALNPETDYKPIRSALSYQGCKFKLINCIREIAPDCKRFHDVFGGSGTVAINVLDLYDSVRYNELDRVTYSVVKQFKNLKVKPFIRKFNGRVNKFGLNRKDKSAFEAYRDWYNSKGKMNPFDAYVLSRHSFSSQMRFSKNEDKYNLTFGQRGGEVSNAFEKQILGFVDAISEVSFSNMSAEQYVKKCLSKGQEYLNGSVFYFDPPYYASGDDFYRPVWGKAEEIRFLQLLSYMYRNNIKFILSNTLEHRGHVNKYLKKFIDCHPKLKVYLPEHKGKGELYSLNRAADTNDNETIEVLITNF